MKNLRFALCGMVILLCALFSCSFFEPEAEEEVIEEAVDDETAAEEETPIIPDEEPSSDDSLTGDEPDSSLTEDEVEDDEPPSGDSQKDDPQNEYPHEGDPHESDSSGDNDLTEPSDDQPFDDQPLDDQPQTDPPQTDPMVTDPPDDGDFTKPSEDPAFDEPPIAPSSKLAALINELRTEYSGTALRAEYIELKIIKAGNLNGLKVFIASNTQNPLIYEFAPLEVREGEYIVLHLRTLEGSCKDEYGDDLNESGGLDSSPDARDFWIPGNTELLRKTDAVYIMSADNLILDAVIFCEDNIPVKSAAFINAACEFLFYNNAWKSSDGSIPSSRDSLNSTGIGSAFTRSISRDETVIDSNTAADWYVTVNNGVTPGKLNNPNRLQ